jgi:hypothetical protein
MSDPAGDDTPYDSSIQAAYLSSPRDGLAILWRWAAHCLLGLLLGAVGAAVQREQWNTPIHWANIVPAVFLLPVYFFAYAVGYGLWDVGGAICLVMLSYAVAFNGLFYVLHETIDRDFMATPLFLLLAYLLLFVGGGSLLKLVRRLINRPGQRTPA